MRTQIDNQTHERRITHLILSEARRRQFDLEVRTTWAGNDLCTVISCANVRYVYPGGLMTYAPETEDKINAWVASVVEQAMYPKLPDLHNL